MANSDRIVEGVFAVNKPKGQSSAQVLRNLQGYFNDSKLFAPWMREEKARRDRESRFQKRRRSAAKRDVQVKLGHGGTLDPMATGVLIVGAGKGTKELNNFLGCTKTYETVVLFGAATDTYDSEGKVVGRKPFGHITEAAVRSALEQFKGKTMQTPPIFSALWIDGKRLYEYAREGKELPRPIEQREVTVSELELLEWMDGGSHDYRWPAAEADPEEKLVAQRFLGAEISSPNIGSINSKRKLSEEPIDQTQTKRVKDTSATNSTTEVSTQDVTIKQPSEDNRGSDVDAAESKPVDEPTTRPPACRLRLTVSSGFYVRSFCQDLGKAVGSLGLMAALIRSRQAGFELGKNVLEYEDLEEDESTWAPKVDTLLQAWESGEIERPVQNQPR